MGRQFQSWRSNDGQSLWLSMLVDTMEAIARPESRKIPCDLSVLIAARAHLAQPASLYLHGACQFSLRN